MNLSDIIQRIADDSNLKSTVSDVKARIIREINRVGSALWDGFRWSFRWRNYRIVTDVDYSTGTVTATNGSRTITGSGTTFLSSHKNWHIGFLGDGIQNWYKVRAFTSATQLELDVPYTGTTGAGKTYVLRHFDYVLPTEPWDLASVVVTHNRALLRILEPYSLELIGPVPYYTGYPQAVAIYSSDFQPTVYSTGTVSGTLNTATLTGSGTSWLANIYPGDSVAIGTYMYQVATVDSDTQISLYQNQQITSTSATYTITRQFGRIMRVMWPSTDAYTLDIRALRKYAPMVNDNDTNELFDRYPNMLCLQVAALELSRQNDVRGEKMYARSEIEFQKAKAEDDALTVRDQIAPIYSYRTDRRNAYGDSLGL